MPDRAPLAAVTFDVGQTLTSLDTRMLSERVGQLGGHASVQALDRSLPEAWRVYNDVVRRGTSPNTWKTFMSTLLAEAGEAPGNVASLTDQLWSEQPARNLWRRPVPGMIELVDELCRAGVPVGIVSNSEGHVAELLDELGWLDRFAVVADSGRLGFEKPDPRIFMFACNGLGVEPSRVAHVGDSRSADVDGALGAGLRAVWFGGEADGLPRESARACSSPGDVARVLAEWGVPLELTGVGLPDAGVQ